MDFAFMEGATALDPVRRDARVFGGPADLNYDPVVQMRFVDRMLPRWAEAGWTIGWLDRWAYDLYLLLGVDPGTFELNLESPPGAIEACFARREWVGVILVRGDDVRVAASAHEVAPHLAALLARWDELPRYEAGSDGADGATALVLDPDRRRVEVVAPLFAALNRPHHLADEVRAALPGWEVALDVQASPVPARLQARGIALGWPEAPPTAPRDPAELDARIDEILAYAPEEEIARLEDAARALIADRVAEAEASGLTVVVSGRLAED
jgi:hypothetical protein